MAKNKASIQRSYYVEGSTARQLHVANEDVQSEDVFVRQHKAKRKRRSHANQLIICFAIFATLIASVIYVKTEMTIRNYYRQVNKLEKEYKEIKEDNDTLLESMTTAVDLETVYIIATEELGMVLPNGEQVKYYEGNLGGSYMEQVVEIDSSEATSGQLTSILGFVTKGW